MTQRHLPVVLFITALLFPALACAASEEEMLHAFGDAARTLPPVPVQKPKPQLPPVAKPVDRPVVHAADQREVKQLRARISELEKQLAARQTRSDASTIAAPQSDAERDGYTLGQSIASNAVAQLQMVKDVGLDISMDQLIAGVTTQLKTGTSALSSKEMAQRYATMQASINKGMSALIAKGYAQLNQQLEKRKALRAENGMHWFAVKSVQSKLIPDQPVELNVKVSTLSGKVINNFADDNVPFDNHLPPLMHDGMSLTGKGGEVEGWALAKDIFEREPLPPWVAPYDVIHYQLAIK